MSNINLNTFAREVAYLEGGKEQVNIAQIKELLNALFTSYSLEEIVSVWFKYNKTTKKPK